MPEGEPRRPRPAWLDAAALLLAAACGWSAARLGVAWSRTVLLDFGPNDAGHVQGFRTDWERDGRTRFRWTTTSSTVALPFRAEGDGHVLALRLRRHFIEPARVTLRVEGRTVTAFDIQADTKTPYRIVEVPLPNLEGRHPFVLAIESQSGNRRPLGVAVDWMELRRTGTGRLVPPGSMLVFAALVGAVAFAAPRLAGAVPLLAAAHVALLVAAILLGSARDPMAAERILREGAPVYATVALVSVLLARWRRSRAALGIESPGIAGALTALVLAALAVRLVLLLHTQFFYPDVKVHGLFAWELARRGPVAFLRDFTVNQYRYSLGLQMENGHWYAFPYPPLFYGLCWPWVALGYRPEAAVAVVAAAVNSLEALVIFGIARALTGTSALAVASAAAHPLLPIFIARLTLAYFPALVGHALDAVVILYLLARLADLDRPRVVLTLGALLALAFLAYTQSLLNFASVVGLFVVLQLGFAREPQAARRAAGLAVASVLGVALATAVFYGRYVPIFLDMRRGIPMPEEQVLLQKIEQQKKSGIEVEAAGPDVDDPYAGPGIDPMRGLRKAGWRLWIFYGLFAPIVVAGVVLLYLRCDSAAGRFVAAWALTYLVLNLASGGLPGPNLVRYNKDMEVVAPLACIALATVGLWLWARARPLAVAYGLSFLGFGAFRAWRYFTEKIVIER